jgi:alpha-1,2-mannosyltransferase
MILRPGLRVPAVTPETAALAAAVLVSFCLFCLPSRASDLQVFVNAADDVLSGRTPYAAVDSVFLISGHAFVYPWLAAWLFVPLAVVPFVVAKVVFFVVGVVAVVYGCRLLGLSSGYGVAAVLLSAPFSRNVELGAVNALFFALLAAAWRWRHRDSVLVATLTVLVGVKLFLAPLLLWVVCTKSWRTSSRVLAGVGAFFAISFLVGPQSWQDYRDSLSRLTVAEKYRGMSFEHALSRVLPDAPTHLIALGVGLAVLVAATVVFLKEKGQHGETILFAGCVLAGLLMTPIMWVHYGLLTIFLVLLIRPTLRWAVGISVFTWVIAGTEYIEPLGNLPVTTRFVMFYVLMLSLPVLYARRIPTRVNA